MKFKTDHNAYEPVFAQLAVLLDSDFTIKYDSSDEPLGISATVVDKTGVIGFKISTHLGKNNVNKITYKLIQGLAKSNNQNLVALAPIAAKLYLSNLKIIKFSAPNMLTAISDLRTKDDVDKIYLTEDVQNYLIELIKQYVETAPTTERSYLLVTIIRLYEDITKVASELKVFAYELTGDSTWLPKDVSDLFLF